MTRIDAPTKHLDNFIFKFGGALCRAFHFSWARQSCYIMALASSFSSSVCSMSLICPLLAINIPNSRSLYFPCLTPEYSDARVGIDMLVGPSDGWVGGWGGFL